MANLNLPGLQSGGRRIDFYAKVGRYFTADGELNEAAFRAGLREDIAARHNADEAARWLSAHLEELLAYLEERGLARAALMLFDAAMEESAAHGMPNLSLSPGRLRSLMSQTARGAGEGDDERTRRRNPDAKRRRIFEIALEEFTARGFHEVTMDEIAAKSGVAKGTVYRYFASKDELLAELLKATGRALAERFRDAFEGGGSLPEQIRRFIEDWVGFIEENHALYRLAQSEGVNGPAGRQTMFYEYLLSDFPLIKERMAAMNTDGVLKTPNFHTVAYGVLGFIDGITRKWFRSGMSHPLRDEVPVILEVVFNGILSDPSRGATYYRPPEAQ